MNPEPVYDLAHLGHMELLTPKPDESQKFFVDVMGMTVSGRQGESVYLRGWDDYERYSLKLTASNTSGMGHMALRARSPQALERRVAALKGSGFDIGWTDGDMGQGRRRSAAAIPTATSSSSITRPNGTRRRTSSSPP
jgi:catechol 2,3-dioxygenase